LAAKKQKAYDYKDACDCSYCATPTAFRSHRTSVFEYLRTRLSGKVPFRCTKCKRRFWIAIDPRDI
jgi:hypothetical protein